MNIKLSPLFSDGMVLQRNKKIKVFGTAAPYKSVTVIFQDSSIGAVADESGKWLCELGEFSEGGPYEMRVVSGENQIIIKDVLIGDVWLCGGQSNMELMMNRTKNMYPDDMAAEYPAIRQFKVPQVYSFHEPQYDISEGCWETFSSKTAEAFTAVGYFFAKKLYEKYKVPIGLLACAVGGTPINAWMSREMLENFPEALAEADRYSDDAFTAKQAVDYANYSNEFFKALGERDEGFKQNWNAPSFDDKAWDEIPICEKTGDLGVYWYRKTFDIPEKLSGKTASFYFGTSIESFDVYINGEKKGGAPYRYPPCEFDFTLPQGSMTVAIRLVSFSKMGGFIPGKNRFIACGRYGIRLDGMWKRRKGADTEPFKGEDFIKYKPAGLFNGMVSPLTKYSIKGAIWYQGESDAGDPDSSNNNWGRYDEKFKLLINGWRKYWNIGDFPFLFVELAHWGEVSGDGWDKLRAKQRDALVLPCTGMAAAFDLGETNDLHPQNKRDVGERLARLAMRIAYGEELPNSCFELCGEYIEN